jgi:hypothetical protein
MRLASDVRDPTYLVFDCSNGSGQTLKKGESLRGATLADIRSRTAAIVASSRQPNWMEAPMATALGIETRGVVGSETELERLLAEGRRFSAEFPFYLANHLPMILVALHRMGASDERLGEYFVGYRDANRLQPSPAAVAPIARADWTRARG